ncbi:phage tail protein [Oscillospiraceae bacterium]|nr:phage tail protein [Oscillospiraceae bacterium]BDF74447.1 phage tail protein [Oscillospiraceae bacterium]
MAMVYPFKKYNYSVQVDGRSIGGFQEITAPDVTSDPIEYRAGYAPVGGVGRTDGQPSGLNRYGNVTLKWGITSSSDFYNWFKEIESGQIIRKNLTISLVDDAGTEVAKWTLESAWPTKFVAPDFNVANAENAIELIELAHEGVTRDL